MCEMGTCRPCRMEERRLDREMGSTRTYIIGRLPTLQENIESRKVIGHSLLATKPSKVMNARPPELQYEPGITRNERQRRRRAYRKSQTVMVDGQKVSTICDCHGTLAGYKDWYCHCKECVDAYHAFEKSKQIKVP